MADYRLGANADFSWLGNLPDVYREAGERRLRKSTLSDLKSGSADDLIAAGARLLSTGDTEGLKIIAEGRQRKAVEQRGEELRMFMSQPGLNLGGLTGGGAGAAETGPVTFPGGGAAPQGPDLFQGRPGAIPGVGPRSEAPVPPGPQQAAAPPSPSDAIIAAAQGAQPGAPPGQQLAGPPPTPNTLLGQTPAMSAETLNAAAAPAVPAAPVQAGVPAMEPPSAQGVRPNQTPPEVARNISIIAQEMAKPTSKYSAGKMKALSDLMKQQIELTKWDKDTKAFMVDQADRRAAGEPVQSRSAWEAENKTLETTYKSAVKKYEGYSEDAQKGQSLNTVVGAMEGIVNHPQFAAGVGSPVFAQGVSALSALRDTAKVLGVPQNVLDKFGDISKLTTPAALQEAFTALSNQAIYAKLGSLGNQISEGDRNFIKLAFPSLSLTKEGNIFLLGIMKKMADNAEKSGAAAQQYFESAGPRANPAIMDRMVREASKENSLFVKDGKVTDAGEAVREAVKQARGGTLQAPEQPKAAPPAAGRPMIQPGQTIYDKQGKPHTVNPDGSVSPLGGGST